MEPEAVHVYELAKTLGALLPHRRLGQPPVESLREAFRLMQRLEDACYAAGLQAQDTVVIAEALSSYLLGRPGRFVSVAAEVERAKAILNRAARGQGGYEWMKLPPAGTVLSDQAIAQFLAWRLMVELPEES